VAIHHRRESSYVFAARLAPYDLRDEPMLLPVFIGKPRNKVRLVEVAFNARPSDDAIPEALDDPFLQCASQSGT
jgi:hypothetical protein